jgi:hypothetical protein
VSTTRQAGAAFVSEISDAIEQLKHADVAQLARQARLEGQWLEFQGEWSGALKGLQSSIDDLKRLLTTNGSGGG